MASFLNIPEPGPGSIQDRRPNPDFRVVDVHADNFGTSNYHALQVKVEKRFSDGLTFLTSYTLSKNTGLSFSIGSTVQDPRNPHLDKALSELDIPHNFTTSLNYQIPSPFSDGLANVLLTGWEIGTIISLQSGMPFTPTQSGDPTNTGRPSRPDRLGSGELSNPTVDLWFDPSAFAEVPAASFRYGDSGKNIIRGPSNVSFDFSVYKNFGITEEMRMQFRAEFFNLPNHPNFGQPSTNISNPALAGRILTAGDPRIIQFGLKIIF
jgi:hypothetical protein